MIAGFGEGASWSTDRLERFSCPTDFGRRYRARLDGAAGLRVVLGAAAAELLLDAAGERAVGVEARTPEGESIAVAADRVVVAMGGL